jgi:hypothetical protein
MSLLKAAYLQSALCNRFDEGRISVSLNYNRAGSALLTSIIKTNDCDRAAVGAFDASPMPSVSVNYSIFTQLLKILSIRPEKKNGL